MPVAAQSCLVEPLGWLSFSLTLALGMLVAFAGMWVSREISARRNPVARAMQCPNVDSTWGGL